MERSKTFRRQFTTHAGRKFQVTYFTIAGTTPGPVLTVIAGQHGMEHSGPNLLPEFIEELKQIEFAGTVHVCPCANPLALEMDYEFYPEKEDLSKINDYYYSRFRHNYCPWKLGRDDGDTMYNMNRLWNHPQTPGVAGEIVKWLWDETCADANIIVDMHCLQAEKPLIFNSLEKNVPIARYCGIEAIVMCNPAPDIYHGGNLTWQGSQGENQYAICIEFSRQHGLKESEYELGKQALRNIMIGARMTNGEVVLPRPVWKILYDNAGQRMKAEHDGHIRYLVNLYDEVKKGDKIYEIRDIESIELLETGIATNDGVVCGISHLPVMKKGVLPCWIAEAELVALAGQPLEKLPADFFGSFTPKT